MPFTSIASPSLLHLYFCLISVDWSPSELQHVNPLSSTLHPTFLCIFSLVSGDREKRKEAGHPWERLTEKIGQCGELSTCSPPFSRLHEHEHANTNEHQHVCMQLCTSTQGNPSNECTALTLNHKCVILSIFCSRINYIYRWELVSYIILILLLILQWCHIRFSLYRSLPVFILLHLSNS